MKEGRIAIPSLDAGGIDGQRSGHFGHCDVFTLVDVAGGEIKQVTTIPNQDHVQGGCMVPVNLLAGNKVKALIVGASVCARLWVSDRWELMFFTMPRDRK